MNDGWIKIHRKMIDWEWYQDNNVKILWLHLLLNANHSKQKWQGIEIDEGQLITSYSHLATQTKMTIQQVRTALDKLKSTNEITIKTTNKYTVITIEKYTLYQCDVLKNNTQNNIQPNNRITIKQQTNNKQITTNKNDKNDKNERMKEEYKKESKKSFDDLIEDYTSNENLQNELKNHLQVRKQKKASLTNRAIELELNTLNKLAHNDEDKIKIVQQSIERGWIGFFGLKEEKNKNGWDYITDEFNEIKNSMPF